MTALRNVGRGLASARRANSHISMTPVSLVSSSGSVMHRTLAVVALCSCLAIPTSLVAQEDKPDAQPSAEELEKQWAEFAKPGPEHKEMARLVGEWTVEAKTYYEDPEN